MSLLSIAQARALLTVLTLSDDDLQDVIDREEAEMTARLGAAGDGVTEITETVPRVNGVAFLSRPAVSITSVAEAAYPGATASALAASAYSANLTRGQIHLYPAGGVVFPPNDRTVVTVVYVPVDDRAQRRSVLIDLVRLAVERGVTRSESAASNGASYAYTFVEFDRERARLYRRLAPVGM